MKIAWLTDIHLDWLDRPSRWAFHQDIQSHEPDRILITGDIAQADTVATYLEELAAAVGSPVLFCLGNHDFYGGSIHEVRKEARALSSLGGPVRWVAEAGILPLTRRTAVVGHDGWGDATCGDLETTLELNDFRLIRELKGSRAARLPVLRALGEEAATHLGQVLPRALASHEHVIVLTHVPPFPEAAWHEGRTSDPFWLPYFCCGAAGRVLERVAREHPERKLTVLCGHTHSGGRVQVLPNLTVLTGEARYGAPVVQRVMSIA